MEEGGIEERKKRKFFLVKHNILILLATFCGTIILPFQKRYFYGIKHSLKDLNVIFRLNVIFHHQILL